MSGSMTQAAVRQRSRSIAGTPCVAVDAIPSVAWTQHGATNANTPFGLTIAATKSYIPSGIADLIQDPGRGARGMRLRPQKALPSRGGRLPYTIVISVARRSASLPVFQVSHREEPAYLPIHALCNQLGKTSRASVSKELDDTHASTSVMPHGTTRESHSA